MLDRSAGRNTWSRTLCKRSSSEKTSAAGLKDAFIITALLLFDARKQLTWLAQPAAARS
jgi:hypothetical protein